MRLAKLRQADLNLLVVFSVLEEERRVSKAALRLGLSQPAVSRALARLRETFHDDLLVRTPAGYELTPQGARLREELETVLPRLDRLLGGTTYDPSKDAAEFRIAATDYASHVICPLFCRTVLSRPSKVSIEFVYWHEGVFEALEHGQLHMVLNATDGQQPTHLLTEVLFDETFSCVVASEAPYGKRLTLEQYLAAPHVGATILGRRQTIPDQRMTAIGRSRRIAIRVPYFAAAMRSVAGTLLVATVPARIAEDEPRRSAVKLAEPPPEMFGFQYQMIWHPRLDSDPAHTWLRETLRTMGRALSRGR
jgi:DNA-binding transcriptional LysR family regulator